MYCVQGLIGTFGGIIMWQFGFYWYQDAFPHGYYFWGYKLASTAASAISISGMISQVGDPRILIDRMHSVEILVR